MKTLNYHLNTEKKIHRYWLLSKNLALLIDDEGNYAIQPLEESNLIEFRPLPVKLESKNLRLSVALPYFALAEDYGQKAVILSIEDALYQFPFERGDYHVKHCCFPLELYEEDGQHFLLYGSDWNRIEQLCLNTKKSLIPPFPKDSEEREIDYFHSSIQLSPNKKEFLSNGWVWQPFDIIYRFKLDEMQEGKLNDFQDIQIPMGTGYNWDRPLCWINNNLIGIGYNPREDEDENYPEDSPSQILIYDLSDDTIIKKLSADCFALTDYAEVYGELYYHKQLDAFIALNSKNGLHIISRNGEILVQTMEFKDWNYNPSLDLFYNLKQSNELLTISSDVLVMS